MKCACYDQSERAHYISIIYTQALNQVKGCLHGTSQQLLYFFEFNTGPSGSPVFVLNIPPKKNVMPAQIQPNCYFAAVQNLIYVVLCKQGARSHFGTKSAPRWTGIFIHSSWCRHIGHKWSSSHPTKKLLSVQLFLCKHCLM